MRQRRQRGRLRPRRRQQGHAGPETEQDVADLADAVEGEQTLGLLLLERLHGAGEERDRAQHRHDQTPARQGKVRLRRRGHQPEEIAHQAIDAGLDHHAGKHGAHRRRRGGVRVRQPELPEGPHAHLDAKTRQEQRERRGREDGLGAQQRRQVRAHGVEVILQPAARIAGRARAGQHLARRSWSPRRQSASSTEICWPRECCPASCARNG